MKRHDSGAGCSGSIPTKAVLRRSMASAAIGSGLVEGSCKAVVGKRLKQTGARWRVRHAEQMVAGYGRS